jgi:hypothetical protein
VKVKAIRRKLKVKYKPPGHTQDLTEQHNADGAACCEKRLSIPADLPRTKFLRRTAHCSGEIYAIDIVPERWTESERNNCDRQVQEISCGVWSGGIQYKSRPLIVDGTIDPDKGIENLASLEVVKNLDEAHGQFEWIVQQESADAARQRNQRTGSREIIASWI